MNISVLLQYFSDWVIDVKYEGYRSDDIVISKRVTYEKLIFTVVAEHEIDETWKQFQAWCIIIGDLDSLFIHNDMGLKLYIEVKKKVLGFGMYPLCITTIDNNERKMLFEGESGEVIYLESTYAEGLELALLILIFLSLCL